MPHRFERIPGVLDAANLALDRAPRSPAKLPRRPFKPKVASSNLVGRIPRSVGSCRGWPVQSQVVGSPVGEAPEDSSRFRWVPEGSCRIRVSFRGRAIELFVLLGELRQLTHHDAQCRGNVSHRRPRRIGFTPLDERERFRTDPATRCQLLLRFSATLSQPADRLAQRRLRSRRKGSRRIQCIG